MIHIVYHFDGHFALLEKILKFTGVHEFIMHIYGKP